MGILSIFSNIKLILGSLVVSLIIGGIFYIDHLRSKVNADAITQNELKNAISNQKATIDQVTSDANRINQAQAAVSSVEQKVDSASIKLPDRVRVITSTIIKTIPEKEGTVVQSSVDTRALNDTDEVSLRCVEISSGSPITDADQRNTLCPELINASK